MNETQVLEITRDGLLTLLLVVTPVLLIGMVIGLLISLVQTLTQIQEMTLTFVPKLVLVFLALILLMPFMFHELKIYSDRVFDIIVAPQ